MKKLALIMTILIPLISNASSIKTEQCPIRSQFSDQQWGIIEKGYNAANEFDYGLTLAAIIIEESDGGLWRVNPDSRDFGVTQINIKTGVIRLGYKNTSWNRSVVASKLVADDDLAISVAVEEILFWHEQHNGYWKHVVASYNKGYNVERGMEVYYPKIAPLVNELKKGCFNEEEDDVQKQDRLQFVLRENQERE